jgi:2-amino-4-hydroxy-6-hydroxymethyldihydropteridine diphosphokinase
VHAEAGSPGPARRDGPANALIGLGSNLGDRLGWLRFARARIARLPSTSVVAASSVFETEPVGGPPQGPYLNACLSVETALAPHALLAALQEIESAAGRARGEANAPRTLDLDLLLFGAQEIADARLVVPHPRFADRAFALIPAAEIASGRVVARGSATIGSLAARASAAGVRRWCGEEGWR